MNKLIPGYRGTVNAWECDQMGHMNVQFYSAKCSQAFGHLQNALGLSPAQIREDKKGLTISSVRIQFKSELHAGSVLHGFCGIREVKGEVIHGFIHLFDTAFYKLSSVFEFTAHYTDLISSEALPLPAKVRKRAEDLSDEHPKMYRPAPFAGALMPPVALDHMFESGRSSVNTWECDSFGNIEMRHIIGYFSNAVIHVLKSIGLSRGPLRGQNLGSAALDYRSDFHAPLKMSVPLATRSGLIGAEGKIFRFGHNLINLDTGKIAVTTTVLGCYFDMATRKSIPLPEEFTNYPKEKLLEAQF
ncbi:thioesterase family protein [Sneathiella sp.]|uniref:thioesterase family protein n=1 Tax=Sneathiella sp. TaxID=1964365 RepID=UPI00356A1D6C